MSIKQLAETFGFGELFFWGVYVYLLNLLKHLHHCVVGED